MARVHPQLKFLLQFLMFSPAIIIHKKDGLLLSKCGLTLILLVQQKKKQVRTIRLLLSKCGLLQAKIISSDTQGVVPATFEFEAEITGGTGPYTYRWDFGDGSVEIDDDETIVHTFDVAGTYNVDLTVIDSGDQTVSASIEINVEAETPIEPERPQAEEE